METPKKITLKTLPNATEQEVFDYVVHHLLTQNQKSILRSNDCRYRGENNLKCAAGCLIDDDEYKPEFETITWFNLSVKGCFPTEHRELIQDLQYIHDFYNVENWENKLKLLAGLYNLNFNFKL